MQLDLQTSSRVYQQLTSIDLQTKMKFSRVIRVLCLITFLSLSTASHNDPYDCDPDSDLRRCIDTYLAVIPGTSAAQSTFCTNCRSQLERYATNCLHVALAAIYNNTIARVCEKQSDFDCIPSTAQRACFLRYGPIATVFSRDEASFCSQCRSQFVDYTRTCVGETAAQELKDTLDTACDSASGAGSIQYSAISALLLALISSLN